MMTRMVARQPPRVPQRAAPRSRGPPPDRGIEHGPTTTMARSSSPSSTRRTLLAGFERRRAGRGLRDRKLAQHLARRGDAEVVLDAHASSILREGLSVTSTPLPDCPPRLARPAPGRPRRAPTPRASARAQAGDYKGLRRAFTVSSAARRRREGLRPPGSCSSSPDAPKGTPAAMTSRSPGRAAPSCTRRPRTRTSTISCSSATSRTPDRMHSPHEGEPAGGFQVGGQGPGWGPRDARARRPLGGESRRAVYATTAGVDSTRAVLSSE